MGQVRRNGLLDCFLSLLSSLSGDVNLALAEKKPSVRNPFVRSFPVAEIRSRFRDDVKMRDSVGRLTTGSSADRDQCMTHDKCCQETDTNK